MAASQVLRFSTFEVTRQVFYKTKYSLCLVNLKPIVDNHVLVIPRRFTPRLADLSPAEVSDLFQTVQTVGKVLEEATKAKSLTIACQDGAYAGQSVPHVHVHIIPRRPGDFQPMDAIYESLETVDIEKDFERQGQAAAAGDSEHGKLKIDAEREARTAEDMESEATWLASLFPPYQENAPETVASQF